MKYTIELTENQKKQMDLLCELAHRYIGFNPKLEMIETTNVEDTKEYQIGYKVGFEDGAKAQNEEQYSKGSEDARQTLLNLLKIPSGEWGSIFDQDSYYVEAIFKHYSISEIAERIEAYEEKKKAEEIKVGDVVKFNEKCHSYEANKDREYLVLHNFGKLVTLLYDNGDTGAADIILLDKTGRHIEEVEQLLSKLQAN